MPKQRIRQRQLRARSCLSAVQRSALSLQAQQRLLEHPLFIAARVVALYAPIRCEVETGLLLEVALATNKRVVYPRVEQVTSAAAMQFIEVNSGQDLQPGAFGVLEPQGLTVVEAEDIDFMVVPGVAFDCSGHRLGYGKGFYDRAVKLCSPNCALVGLGYASQVEESLPYERHDLMLDWLITDHEVLCFANTLR